MTFHLRKRPWSAGFSEATARARLAAIRWKADRGWTAWHVHDIRFLLSLIPEEGR